MDVTVLKTSMTSSKGPEISLELLMSDINKSQ